MNEAERVSVLDDVSVLLPYREFGTARDEAFVVVRRAWAATSVELVVEGDAGGAHPGEFNHPAAINAAARRATRRVFIVADADCLWAPESLPIDLVWELRFGAPWALPVGYAKLNERQTKTSLGSGLGAYTGRPEWYGDQVSWAGLVAIPAASFRAIGGYDERYAWWGADDMAFGLKADTLLGRHQRVPGSVVHLRHPAPLGETYGHERHREQYALGERYKLAVGNAEEMRKLAGLPADWKRSGGDRGGGDHDG